MQKINLREHQRDPQYYNRDRDIETALAWNATKKTLEKVGRHDLFAHIQSIKLTPKNIIITTHKPIVNREILFYERELLDAITTQVRIIGGIKRERVRVK